MKKHIVITLSPSLSCEGLAVTRDHGEVSFPQSPFVEPELAVGFAI